MDSRKTGIIFVIIGILATSSFLIYPYLRERTEMAVPVLKSFSDSSISEELSEENTASDKSEIWEDADEKPTTGASLPIEEPQSETASAAEFPIDLNAASAEELMQIKGIGRVIAENIVLYRESFGYFYSVEDLTNVDGIGGKKLDGIRDYVYISEELLPETAAAARETVTTAGTSSAAVTTVPTSRWSVSAKKTSAAKKTTAAKKTSVKTTVTAAAETEDTDDGIIIDEIIDDDYYYVTRTETQSSADKHKTTYKPFAYTETKTEAYRPNFPLELNTASAKDLAYIDGIGDAIAQRIVEYARSYGFYDVNDLLNVSGIGPGKLSQIAPYVYADASGLPPKPETESSFYYEDVSGGSDNSYVFSDETAYSAAPAIYKININTAGKADFMQLPGIDEALAENIISLRSQIGGFAVIEELSLVDGMTNIKLSAIWDYIYV